jgi:outer membrane receptor protein involved in Fe transport
MPGIYNGDMAPERATAYEIGVTVAVTRDLSADLTAYYRDTRNAYINGSYTITVAKTSGGGLGNYSLPWGYRDSRGFELNLNKRPTPERYFGVFGLAGNLSLSYSYDKGSSLGLSMVTDQSARVNLTAGGLDENWDFDTRYLWPSYSRPFNYWRGKLTLMFDFPMGFKLSTLTTYNSAPYFSKTVNVTSARYEETYQGMAFVQTDVRLLKYFAIGNYKAGLFVEALNVFDRLNVLYFDSYNYNTMYEIDRKPWGPFWRATDGSGNPYAGIAREIYAGIEFSF